MTDLAELAAVLSSDDAESVTLGSSALDETGKATKDNMILMNRVISEKELDRLLDRSPEAFLSSSSKSKNASSSSSSAANSAAGVSLNGDGGRTDEVEKVDGEVGNRFREIEEERDESNDALAHL